jgi:hypothetical protein
MASRDIQPRIASVIADDQLTAEAAVTQFTLINSYFDFAPTAGP